MNSKLVIIGTCIFGLSACLSTPQWIVEPLIKSENTEQLIHIPALSKVNSVGIGENMYSQLVQKTEQTYTVVLDDSATGNMELGNSINLNKGTKSTLRKHSQSDWNAMCLDFSSSGMITGSSHTCLVDQNSDNKFDHSMFKNRDRYFPLNKPVPYTVSNNDARVKLEEESFKRSVIFQGTSRSTVKVSFREFLNNLARPAFTQDIQYDLNEDGTALIAFKDLRIKVIKTSNTEINYIVIKGFSGN